MKMKREELERLSEFDNHIEVVKLDDPASGLKGYIAIHRQHGNQPSLGATRLWQYASEDDALRDALRLSRLMSFKSAAAGLPYGGAKAALIGNPQSQEEREHFFTAYARKVNELNGRFVTGTDVGLQDADLAVMSAVSPYMIGQGVDAAFFTAVGVLYSIEVCLGEIYGSEEVAGRRFAIQGMGKTGFELVKLLAKAGAEYIAVSDINIERVAWVKEHVPTVTIISPDEIHTLDVDVFSPCALSGMVNEETIPVFRCKAIVGSANNQLAAAHCAELLEARGILYAPDYVVNAGGLISVVDQFEHGTSNTQRIEERLKVIKTRLEDFFAERKKTQKTIVMIADELTQARF